jgi:hypothetical protein
MDENVQVKRLVFGKNTYTNVINTQFTQLVPQPAAVTVTPPLDVPGFFSNYNQLFYDIPPSGSYSGSLGMSHLDLVNRSSAYIGISYQDLITEITELRTQNVSLQNQIFTISYGTGSSAVTTL